MVNGWFSRTVAPDFLAILAFGNWKHSSMFGTFGARNWTGNDTGAESGYISHGFVVQSALI